MGATAEMNVALLPPENPVWEESTMSLAVCEEHLQCVYEGVSSLEDIPSHGRVRAPGAVNCIQKLHVLLHLRECGQ